MVGDNVFLDRKHNRISLSFMACKLTIHACPTIFLDVRVYALVPALEAHLLVCGFGRFHKLPSGWQKGVLIQS